MQVCTNRHTLYKRYWKVLDVQRGGAGDVGEEVRWDGVCVFWGVGG